MERQLNIIIGVSSFLGQQVASLLLNNGQLVAGTFYEHEDAIGQLGDYDRFFSYRLNVTDANALHRFVKLYLAGIIEQHHIRSLNIIYCCGAWYQGKIKDWKPDDFDRVYQVNVKAPCVLTSLILAAGGWPCRFVFVSGLAGDDNAFEGNGLYGLCTNSIRFFTRVLSKELVDRSASACVLLTLGLFDKGQPYYASLINDIGVPQYFSVPHVAALIHDLVEHPSRMVLLNGSELKAPNNITSYEKVVHWLDKYYDNVCK
ncbi:SDR family NAD(P)-dependent oxidoreductase [Chitinophaga sp. 22321]|uniref:SDR family NAD(P)-dependent oxidoreductase n=1 Tax=Chitinophaga hostae TaxID=2831022 RepID=A0ABS5J993_9BACT|nr:SDR family NAD(P)-dependent oxidoreductase [Chitinophaga hostae]MBS0031793.1 SDR family NAD(P)-dependent oxidoreductase [Chitinophaga hostae]